MDIPSTQQTGQLAEQEACEFLKTKGLKLIHRNYRCLCGEIDLIMQDQQDIVFIEVRVRNHPNYGDAVESVNKSKQKKIIKTASYFLQQHKWFDKVNCRFDVIGISYTKTKAAIEWIQNAFP